MRIGSVLKHSGQAVLEGALIASMVVALMAGTALAGKGGHSKPGTTTGNGTIAWVMVVDANGNNSPNWGDTIRFDVKTTATTEPHVSLTCKQGGTVVYGATTGYYASYPWPWTQEMQLSSQSWASGSASCVAVLQAYSGSSVSSLASVSFTAGS